ncbi:hypothetical protein JN531_017150 (plasmid) [Flagellatimonas centrodinii]|uniref:hypothetical protein n=1 Tax=Flagellatimonas centrodinii TaxID=2806210 RepID=UPI001FF050D2|nr:hypothetical protein [Flagellatimonas centrodinii]ULQ48360.1 hypothetical protein JN531_017150 [Flagellatimonas centrodinii]
MKAQIRWTCGPQSKTAEYDAEDICIDVELPAVPQIGILLKVTSDGEFVRVDDVYMDLSEDGDGLLVFLKDAEPGTPDFRPWAELKAQGWRLIG